MQKLPDWWEKVRFSKLERGAAASHVPQDDEIIDITKGRTEEFLTAAKEFSEYLKALPLDTEQNARLIELAIRQTQEAERGAFFFGAGIGIDLATRILIEVEQQKEGK